MACEVTLKYYSIIILFNLIKLVTPYFSVRGWSKVQSYNLENYLLDYYNTNFTKADPKGDLRRTIFTRFHIMHAKSYSIRRILRLKVPNMSTLNYEKNSTYSTTKRVSLQM